MPNPTLQVHYNPNNPQKQVWITGGNGSNNDGHMDITAPTDIEFNPANANDTFCLTACVVSTSPIDCTTLPTNPSLPYTLVPDGDEFTVTYENDSSPRTLTIEDNHTDETMVTYHYAIGISANASSGPVTWSDPEIVNKPNEPEPDDDTVRVPDVVPAVQRDLGAPSTPAAG